MKESEKIWVFFYISPIFYSRVFFLVVLQCKTTIERAVCCARTKRRYITKVKVEVCLSYVSVKIKKNSRVCNEKKLKAKKHVCGRTEGKTHIPLIRPVVQQQARIAAQLIQHLHTQCPLLPDIYTEQKIIPHTPYTHVMNLTSLPVQGFQRKIHQPSPTHT
jgi:hypothetical protein